MKSSVLLLLLEDALLSWEASRDELRDLDAAIGDGDLGITVTAGAQAIRVGLNNLPKEAPLVEILKTCAKQFAAANPSTFSALISGGLLAASKLVDTDAEISKAESLKILEALFLSIQTRGKAELGDKTILDAMNPTIEILRNGALTDDPGLIKAMAKSAELAIQESSTLISKRGRAAWVGERTIGHRDGGATAYLRFLEALDRALEHSKNLDFQFEVEESSVPLERTSVEHGGVI